MTSADTKPIPVLVNRGGGTASTHGAALRERLDTAFRNAGLEIDLHLVDGGDMARAAASVAGAPLVVVGGGDGTLGCAAGALAGSGSVMAILALGTRNHLARELGVPLDLDEAARLIVTRTTRAIDLGRVGDRVFVNNASIGIYPALVRRRDGNPAPKWLAAIPATVATLNRLRHHRLRLLLDGREQPVVTPLLFVGNNRYTLDLDGIGTREALDAGKLAVYAVASRRRLSLVGLALRTLVGRADPARDFAAIGDVSRLTIKSHAKWMDVALDGEVCRLPTPISFLSHPGALTVVAPLSGGGASSTSPG